MAFLKRKEPIEINEQTVIDRIYRSQSDFYTQYDIFIPNCYVTHDSECDMFALRRNGLCDEFEVKISRSDFLHDAKKIVNVRPCKPGEHISWAEVTRDLPPALVKQTPAPWQKLKYDALRDGDLPINYFTYVVTEGVASVEDVPDFAGFATVDEFGTVTVHKKAVRLHKNLIPDKQKYLLVRKLAYRFWDYRNGRR